MSTSILSTLPNAGSQDQRQLPLIVAEKWGFPLAFVETEDGVFYAIQDWIKGLTASDDVRKIWNDIQRKTTLFQMSDSIRPLPYIASDGKTYQRDHTTDKGLYLIAQNLRSTKARPALAAIKKYLAESGAFVDEVRRDMVKSAAWLQTREEGKIKRNRFTAALSAAVAEALTRKHYATATDDIYKGLWGRTAAYLKKEMDLPKYANLRDHQPMLALHYQGIAEETAAYKLGNREELTWDEARMIVKTVAALIGEQAKITSEFLQLDLPTGKPLLSASF